MSKWYEAKISSVQPMADDLTRITLDVASTPLVGTHRLPGQHVKLSVKGRGEGYFAIASAPNSQASQFEFLIKGGSPLSDSLIGLTPGATVKLTAPSGKGFPLEMAKGKTLLLFAGGSGISAIRSVIEAARAHRPSFGAITLYFGARTPSAFAYESELTLWEHDGIRVIRTVSQPGNSGWQGLTGYVQSHIEEFPVNNTVAFLCGKKELVRGVTEALIKHGLPAAKIFLNF